MSIDSASTIQGSTSSTESIACGQTSHIRALDMFFCPASPTSEFWDTESQYNDESCRDKHAQDEIAVSPTTKTQPVFAPSDLEESDYSSSYGNGKENRPPAGLAFRIAIFDTCHRLEASGTVDNGRDKHVEMEFDLTLCKPIKIAISLSQSSPPDSSRRTKQCERRDHGGISGSVDTGFRVPERGWHSHEQGHKRQRIHKFRRSKRPTVEC
ncbi:hypothetical protein HRG_013682 [Hirsutella rhossiliensis]